VLLQVARIRHGLLSSHQTVPKPLLSYLLPYSRRSIALVKTTGSPKGWNWSTCPANKVLLKGTRSYIHWWTSNRIKLCLALLSSYIPRTFNCTGKTTGWFTKGLKLIQPAPNKVLLKGLLQGFIYMDGLFQTGVPNRCYLTFFHIPNVQLD
jgi:hypothetical protein